MTPGGGARWRPAKRPTPAQVKRAHELLSPSVWRKGVIEEGSGVQYRGAMHPNKDGSGTHRGVEVWVFS